MKRYKELIHGEKKYTEAYKIDEILVKNKFEWFLDCEVENCRIEITKNTLVFNSGVFFNGTWVYGVFRDGQWKYGTWEGGVWYNGTWYNGIFKNGIIFGGRFLNGKIEGGEIRGGDFFDVNIGQDVANNTVQKIEQKHKPQKGQPQNRSQQQHQPVQMQEEEENFVQPEKIEERVKRFDTYVNEGIKTDIFNKIETVFEQAYTWMCENNQSDNNPYHNNKHALMVFQNSMMLFDIYKKEYNLKSNDKLILGLAAIFHDFNHSGGKLKDSDNIKLALEGLHLYLEKERMIYKYEEIENILEATEFPHKELNLNILQKIIRDADTMGGIIGSDSQYMDIVISLASELNKNLIDFIPMQIQFLDNIKFNTPYCNKILEERREYIKEKLSKLKSDLTSK